MQALNLPDHGVKTKHAAGGWRIFDPVRRLWVALTPEEWVRQHVLNHLMHDLGCPASLLVVERKLALHGLTRRADIVLHARNAAPLLLVECKAPGVKPDLAAFEQAARYNTVFKVPYLLVTNGLVHYCCHVDHVDGRINFLPRVPPFAEMNEAVSA